MSIHALPVPGCFILSRPVIGDERGGFQKFYQSSLLEPLGLAHDIAEVFVTSSHKGVIRGMHFQVPPSDGFKMVACLAGALLDVFFDLRVGSPSYGIPHCIHLAKGDGKALYLPTGIAHGYITLEDATNTLYLSGALHDPARDAGVLWSSIDFDWLGKARDYGAGVKADGSSLIVSPRDQAFQTLAEYQSPFIFEDAS